MTAKINGDGKIIALSKNLEFEIQVTEDLPFYNDWSQAQFYRYLDNTWIEVNPTEFSISKVDYDWIEETAVITLSNTDVLRFRCTNSWTEQNCIAAVKSTTRYKNAIAI